MTLRQRDRYVPLSADRAAPPLVRRGRAGWSMFTEADRCVYFLTGTLAPMRGWRATPRCYPRGSRGAGGRSSFIQRCRMTGEAGEKGEERDGAPART